MIVVFDFETAFFAAVDVVPPAVSLQKDNEFLKRIRKPRVVNSLPAGDIPAFRAALGNEHGLSSRIGFGECDSFFIIAYRRGNRNLLFSNERIESKRFDPLLAEVPFQQIFSALLKRAAGHIDCHESSYNA